MNESTVAVYKVGHVFDLGGRGGYGQGVHGSCYPNLKNSTILLRSRLNGLHLREIGHVNRLETWRQINDVGEFG